MDEQLPDFVQLADKFLKSCPQTFEASLALNAVGCFLASIAKQTRMTPEVAGQGIEEMKNAVMKYLTEEYAREKPE